MENMGIETDLDMNVKELCTLYMKEKYKRDKVKEDIDFSLYLKIKANPNIVLFKNSPIENKDTALKIMEHLDDKTLFNMCLGNKNLAKICNDENFWMRRTLKKFNFKRTDTSVTWKKNYLSLVYYTNKYFSNFALEMATKENFTDLALYIMERVENIKNAENCLLAASKNGNEKLIDIFLKYIPRDYDFSYAIQKAAQGKHKNIIKKFVKLNGKVDWSNTWSKGFEGACKSGDINMVLFFIKKGVLKDVAKKSLYFAGKYNHLNLIEFLINYDSKYVDYNEAFLGAVRGGHNLLMEKFIGKISDDFDGLKNSDVLKNIKNSIWTQALCNAAKNANLKNVEFFYHKIKENKIDFNEWNIEPIILSCAKGGDMKIVKYLFHRYENLKIPDYIIHDALKICMKEDNIEMINFFIDKLPKNYPLKDIYILSYSRYRSVNEFIKNKLIGRQF